MKLWSSRRRRRLTRLWRARRGREQDAATPSAAAFDATPRVRARHRAPTPDFGAPIAALLGNPSRVASLAAAIVLCAMLAHIWTGQRFRVDGATVVGNARLRSAAVYAQSNIDGQLALALDARRVRERLLALADIKDATITVALPNRVTIRIVETAPALLWQAGSVAVAVDEAGRGIPVPADAALTNDLVRITDSSGQAPAVGSILGAGVVAAALAYAPRFGPLTWRGAAEGFSATTDDGWTVLLGADAGQAALQADTLAAFAHGLDAPTASIALVDLRFPNRPYYRLRSGL
ncbi:MAG: FtsQ-type POTRA domain-containing protein [Ardenticatenales bacterium]